MYRILPFIFMLSSTVLLCNDLNARNKPVTVINFTGDNGFQHASQKSGTVMLENFAKKHHWKIISTADAAIFNDKVLASVQLVIFNNNCGNEGAILKSSQHQALMKYVAKGGGFVGIHCAGAIWHEDAGFQEWYENLVGARMVAHPAVQEAVMIVETKNHPATRHLPAHWTLTDEYHTFSTNPRNTVNVLISIDERSYSGEPKMHGDHPMVWCKEIGNARSFFTGLGHTKEIYTDTSFINMIEGGILWALRLDNEKKGSGLPVKNGLLIDLDADKGIFANEFGRIFKWENQAAGTTARFFEKQDEGREIAGSGWPTIKKNVTAINDHNTVVFREQELLNDNEDAFDHLITGNGYTFFCVVAPYQQDGKLEDVNSFFGNLRNGGLYEGIWGGFTDDNRAWAGARNGITFGRWDANNPFMSTKTPLNTGQYYLVMGKMDAGTDSVNLYLMINEWDENTYTQKVKVNAKANASKMSIGQERDATQHPGVESFDGEIARFLLYERPLNKKEMKSVIKKLKNIYNIK